MNENTVYWVWLTAQYRMSTEKVKSIIHRFRSPKRVYEASVEELCEIRGITSQDVKILSDKSLERAEEIIKETERIGAYIVTIDDAEYPSKLREIDLPPYVLYMRGHIDWNEIRGITVIGTRKYTEYGEYVTRVMCAALAENGFTVISGMAEGIDGTASRAALDAGGKTAAVLGSGIDVIYPKGNEDLYNRIIENGVVMTEYPPGTRPLPKNFPHRNRIMSALGEGVLVVEAPERSGALITANRALDMGKNVFAVPGPIFHAAYVGTNRLIQQGAKPVLSPRDIICEYVNDEKVLKSLESDAYDAEDEAQTAFLSDDVTDDAQTERTASKKQVSADDERFAELNDTEKKIISLLIERNYGTDELVRTLGVKMNELNNMLVGLEIQGFVSKLAGNNYKINI